MKKNILLLLLASTLCIAMENDSNLEEGIKLEIIASSSSEESTASRHVRFAEPISKAKRKRIKKRNMQNSSREIAEKLDINFQKISKEIQVLQDKLKEVKKEKYCVGVVTAGGTAVGATVGYCLALITKLAINQTAEQIKYAATEALNTTCEQAGWIANATVQELCKNAGWIAAEAINNTCSDMGWMQDCDCELRTRIQSIVECAFNGWVSPYAFPEACQYANITVNATS